MSEPLELVLKSNPSKVVAYACPDCHCVIHQAHDNAELDASVRKATAEHCIKRCSDCSVVLVKANGPEKNYPGWGTRCVACDEKHDRERDQKQFDEAQHLTEEEWGNDTATSSVVYLEGEDRYFTDGIDELREWWADHHYDKDKPDELPEFPEYVWVCDEQVGVRLDAESILENALEEYYEDAMDDIDVDGLQVKLDEWSNDPANQIRSFSPNYKKLVLLSEEKNAAFLAEWRREST
jgi:hypothetical protein